MKKILLSTIMAFFCLNLFAQCDELFISEYVEGYANNKALEIYNPTNAAVNLSGYSIARFSNGSTSAGTNKVIQLPNVMLAAHDVFVVVIDKTDMSLWCSTLDKPVWDGTNVLDTLFSQETGEAIMDDDGNICFGPQYNEEGCALFGDTYNERYDLQCKADVFLCPVYDTNNAMYFNGNDAVALLSGTDATDISSIIDVIGVIGEDPTETIMQDGWIGEDGYTLTKDRTLVRDPEVTTGRNNPSDIIFGADGTFTGEGWASYAKNSFQFLGIHKSVCDSTNEGVAVDCEGNIVPPFLNCAGVPVSNKEITPVATFKMFPNPNVNGLLNIEAPDQIRNIEISNMLGQKVYSQQITNAITNTTADISNLNKGIFVVNIMFQNNQIATQKLVVE